MKQKTIRYWLLIFILLNISLAVQADNGQSLMPIIPTSPQAESIKRYGEYRVNNAMGIPDVSIPLYEIDHRGYKIPLILRYTPQPLKPGYNYDVFGNGWSLSANSCISRTIESIPDEWSGFKIETDKLSRFYLVLETIEESNFAHDKFTATLPNGTSFNFIIDKNYDGTLDYITSGNANIKISCSYDMHKINSFTVIDEDGVKYTFNGSDTPSIGSNDKFRNCYVSWYLSRIDLPHSTEPILFSYAYGVDSGRARQYEETGIMMKHHLIPLTKNEAIARPVTEYSSNTYKMKLLSSIRYGSSGISFNYQDQSTTATHNYIKSISIHDDYNSVKSISFNMNIKKVNYYCLTNESLAQLKSVTIQGSGNTNSQVYKCTYTGLPLSFAGTDHWGYANQYSSQYDVCRFTLFVEPDLNHYTSFLPGSMSKVNKTSQDVCPFDKVRLSRYTYDNRYPSGPDSHGVLATLQYPTGGFTRFEFENHWFLSSTSLDGDYIYDPKRKIEARGGGFRISKITNYTAENTVSDMKTYRYGKTYPNSPNRHTGLGEAVVDPTILSYAGYTSHMVDNYSIRNMILGLDANGKRLPFTHPFIGWMLGHEWLWECTFSTSNFRRVLNGRAPVVYSLITEYHGDINEGGKFTPEKTLGKTEYKYDIYTFNGIDTLFFEAPKYSGNVLVYDSKPYLYNLLKEKVDYKYAHVYNDVYFVPIRTEKNTWSSTSRGVLDYVYSNKYPRGFYPMNTTVAEFLTHKISYLGYSRLTSKQVSIVNYPAGDGITESESYIYNSRNQIVEKNSHRNGSQWVTTNFSYPQVNNNGTTPTVIQQMLDRNILTPVISEVNSGRFPNSANQNISGYKIDYKEFTPEGSSILMPAEVYELDTKSTSSQYVLKDKIVSYSLHGNPVEVISSDGVTTIFLWGYNYRYLIAAIKNATYSQVEGAVQSVFGVDVKTLSKQAKPDESKLRRLKDHANLKQAMVSTYTYKPLVGVASTTDPSGIVTYYDYDGPGQLKEVYYYEGNIVSPTNKRVVQEYKCNYKNQ
ncbi:hypothetical protein [Bacteroides sp. 519]|uniref:hypothetical protein n=1 Tax=Bacteroides sp. 519 TaxID=2302937 RepID=UPI0013CF4D6D|nr:hypothetical protein [Bacteroides sp. 519]NDV58946.1 hypothetical protein [Bacteroides sp. 519]